MSTRNVFTALAQHFYMNRQIALAVLVAVPLLAADPPDTSHTLSMTAPTLGFLFDDGTKAIRPITGVPGAAGLGAPLSFDSSFQRAWVSSAGKLAIGITKDGQVAVATWTSTPRLTTLATSLGTLREVAFNGSGTQAVLSDGAAAEVWSSLKNAPVSSGRLHPDAGIAAVAINNAGIVAVATPSGLVLRFALAGGEYEAQAIATGGSWTALAFAPGSEDILAADGNELVRLTSAGGRSVLAGLGSAPKALVVSLDGTQVAAALGRDLLLVREGGTLKSLSCDCEARSLEALQGNLVARVVSLDGSIRLLDADAGQPRVSTLSNLSEIPGGSAQ
ncbi:MAG: WD40 repeat domain-containing protein [Acidobacteriota bacterium]